VEKQARIHGLYAAGQVVSPLLIAIILVATGLGIVIPVLKDAGESVRGAFLLLVCFVALASVFGLETILGAFVAGVILRLVDGDRMMTHPQFRQKLEAIGFGVFIPVFFVASGIRFDLAALFSSPTTILRVPIFLAALLLVRGVTAFLYRPLISSRRAVVAGLLQATSLSFIVAASQIGLELGLITKATGAALIAAGLLSVLIFPLLALTLLRRTELNPASEMESSAPVEEQI
jgi:Kef-type K+ transport system membrane component KefB